MAYGEYLLTSENIPKKYIIQYFHPRVLVKGEKCDVCKDTKHSMFTSQRVSIHGHAG